MRPPRPLVPPASFSAEQAAQDYVKKAGEEVAKSVGRQAGNVLHTFMARVGMLVSSLFVGGHHG